MNECNECGAEAGQECNQSCPMYIADDTKHTAMQEAYDQYYAPTEEFVMVPVKVRYHRPTDVVYRFDPPTLEQVEEAVRKHR